MHKSMLHRPQLYLAARLLLHTLECLHGVELGGVVEVAIEHENAPGLHVCDGVEHLHVEAGGEASDELSVGNRVARVARSVHLLDGKGQFEAPLEHHLVEVSLVNIVNAHKHDIVRPA